MTGVNTAAATNKEPASFMPAPYSTGRAAAGEAKCLVITAATRVATDAIGRRRC
jgi:hypothetical protein